MILNLKELKYYYLTIPKNTERMNNMENNFKDLNLTRVYSVTGQNITKEQSGGLGWIKIVNIELNNCSDGVFKPFGMFEDDANKYREFPDYIDVPDNADLLYIGTSIYGYNHSIKWANLNVFTANVEDRTDLYRIFNMLSMHGILVISRRGAMYIKESMEKGVKQNIIWDNIFAGNQSHYNVYCLKTPLVYQDGKVGGCEDATKRELNLNLLNVKIPNNYVIKLLKYTNTLQRDGFGAQYQKIIQTYLFCKVNNLDFLYRPFSQIEHNYNNDPSFVYKIENFINLKNNIDNIILEDNNIQNLDFANIVRPYCEKNIDSICNNIHLEFIKKCFWENKDKNVFKNDKLNIAIHIRRPNSQDNRKQGTDTPDKYYLNIINIIRNRYNNREFLFHIYSQGEDKNFEIFKAKDTILHLNEELPLTFISMVAADILVTSASSISYAAALLSDGVIYYKRFWHNPRKEWFIFD